MIKIREFKDSLRDEPEKVVTIYIHLASVNEFYAQLRIPSITIFQQNS